MSDEGVNWPAVANALNGCLRRVLVRAPLERLVGPRMEFVALPLGGVRFSVRIDTFERESGQVMAGLESSYELPAGSVSYWSERWQRDPMKLASYVRSCLLQALQHELDESIWIDGKRVFEPKHWGPETA